MAATATISYVAEIKDLKAKLASVSDITRAEAKKMVSDLNTTIKAAEKAQSQGAAVTKSFAAETSKAAKETSAFAQVNKNLSYQVFDVIQSIQAGQAPMRALTVQVSDVGFQYAGAAMSAGKLATVLTAGGILAIAIAAGTTAWAVYKNHVEGVKDETHRLEERLISVQRVVASGRQGILDSGKAWAEWRENVKRTNEDLAVARGELTKVDVDASRASRAVVEGAHEMVFAQAQVVEGLRAEMQARAAAYYQKIEDGSVTRKLTQEHLRSGAQLRAQLAEEEQKLADLRAETDAGAKAANDLVRVNNALAISARGAAAATKDQKDELKALREEEEFYSSLHAEFARISAQVSEEQNQRIVASVQERQKAEEDAAVAAQKLAEADARFMSDTTKALQIHRNEVASMQDAYTSLLGAASSIGESIAGFFGTDKLGEMTKGAKIAFGIAQSLAMAEAAINTVLMVSRAAASPPGWPANLPFVLAAAAFGAAQEAAIASATYQAFADTPSPIQVGAGGMSASFAPGDVVVAGRTVDDVDRQLERSGARGGGAQVYVLDSYRHLDRWGRDAMRSPQVYESVRRQARRIVGRR